jgi:hypothetical protein
MSNFSKTLDIVMEHGCSAGSTAASDDASLFQPQKVLNQHSEAYTVVDSQQQVTQPAVGKC